MATNYKLKDYAEIAGKDIFIDANVIIYLFWPTGQRNFEENYARVFRNLLRQGNKLYLDFFIISEVINTVLRIEYQKLNPEHKFKEFRNSQDGKNVVSDIYLIIQNDILSKFNIIGKSFNRSNIEGILIVDQLDFVDKATVSICSENNLILLTNDKDFKNSGLNILTDNPHILH